MKFSEFGRIPAAHRTVLWGVYVSAQAEGSEPNIALGRNRAFPCGVDPQGTSR